MTTTTETDLLERYLTLSDEIAEQQARAREEDKRAAMKAAAADFERRCAVVREYLGDALEGWELREPYSGSVGIMLVPTFLPERWLDLVRVEALPPKPGAGYGERSKFVVRGKDASGQQLSHQIDTPLEVEQARTVLAYVMGPMLDEARSRDVRVEERRRYDREREAEVRAREAREAEQQALADDYMELYRPVLAARFHTAVQADRRRLGQGRLALAPLTLFRLSWINGVDADGNVLEGEAWSLDAEPSADGWYRTLEGYGGATELVRKRIVSPNAVVVAEHFISGPESLPRQFQWLRKHTASLTITSPGGAFLAGCDFEEEVVLWPPRLSDFSVGEVFKEHVRVSVDELEGEVES